MPSTRLPRRAFLRGTAVGAAVGVAGCSALARRPDPEPIPDATAGPDDWPASGYDARNSRYNAGASPPRSEPAPRWTRDFEFWHEPLVRGTRVVVNAERHTVGLRATDGDRLWRSTSTPWGTETPTLGAERAYVTGTDCVFGVNLDGGGETWRGRPCHGANTASGTIADGRLHLEYGGYFSALDATGRVAWASSHDAQGSPAIDGDTAYVATALTVEAVDLTAAANEWPWEDPDDDEPAHASRTAATEWSVPSESRITGPRIYRSPAIADESVYVTVEHEDRPGGELRALARTDGEERWRVASPPARRGGDAPEPVGRPVAPVVADDLVVTSLGDRRLRAVTTEGRTEWTASLDLDVIDLVGAGDALVAATHDRSVESTAPGHAALAAFDLGDGSRLWKKRFEDHVGGLAIAGGTVYATVVTERQGDGEVVGQRLVAFG
ncbi:outer membrane protein assembly factor BamB family protein [Halorarum salinum]|uniref:PQQ-binding-like beta-propeller repeat protein n=1 Tax=Halorarum salinum TaxID=2743089 RepID=A0A7D5QAC0_9EURY|nr:PQQ-binding-like beta-propeller repeat protein [Halobaculum salinum]QLG60241.1 PQQ-binding-like beta-propeller repeat protein [Halobaculum salinum]